DHMQERLAILAGSLLQLSTALENFLAGKNISDISWQGSVSNGKAAVHGAHQWISQRRYDAIAMHWVNGGTVDWPSLYGPVKPRRISLPTYPFARKPYWVTARRDQASAATTAGHKINATVTVGNITDGQLKERALSYFRTKLEEMLMIPAGEIAVDVPLEQYGADSIIITKLQSSLKRVFPTVNNQLFFEYPTLEELVNRLLETERDGLRKLLNGEGQAQSPVQFPELIHLNDNTKGRPVFWMHPIGGGIESYREIAEKSERPFYGISAEGWAEQNILLQGIPALAARYIDVIKSVQATGPYDLGGYSLGGALAYEMARQLQEAGDTVNTIIMLDAVYVPGLMGRLELSYKSLVLQTANLLLQARASREKGQTVLIHRDELDLHLPDDEFLQQVTALARSRGLQKTAEQLNAIVQLNIQVQQACRFTDYRVSPLPDPSAVSCYYFRNSSRSFYGSLAPYCIISPQEDMPIADKDYWLAWQKVLPHFHLVDLDTSSHITLMQEPAALESLFNCCATVYTSQQALLRQTAF
ncbi:MAG TPA: thioesterase domain-containing protein, partial [Chitinophaga sp.]